MTEGRVLAFRITEHMVQVPLTATGIHVLDYYRRTYMALSHDGTYWHLIAPAEGWEWPVRQGRVEAGQLLCSCQGGQAHGTCYRLSQVEAFEVRLTDALYWGDHMPASDGDDHGGTLSTADREAPLLGGGASQASRRSRSRSQVLA